MDLISFVLGISVLPCILVIMIVGRFLQSDNRTNNRH